MAIVLGGTALLAPKGGWLHRKSGIVFVYALLTMGLSASLLGLKQGIINANVLAGFTCGYFVLTALTTVRPVTAWSRRLDMAATAVVFGLAAFDMLGGVRALGSPRFALNGVPAPMFFFLGTVKLAGGIGDLRVLRSGPLRGAARLSRHLWRMCFALFIAAGSFFSIRARVARILPEPFTTPMMRALPIVLLFAAMFYWLWRLRGRRALPVLVD